LVILQQIDLDVLKIILGVQHQSIVQDVQHIILDVQLIILDVQQIILDVQLIILDVQQIILDDQHQSIIEMGVHHTLVIIHMLQGGHQQVELQQLDLRDDLGFFQFDMGLHFQRERYQHILSLQEQFQQLDPLQHLIDLNKHN